MNLDRKIDVNKMLCHMCGNSDNGHSQQINDYLQTLQALLPEVEVAEKNTPKKPRHKRLSHASQLLY